jgi:(E)-4-hydroxy-3-methylbut-2-enyl-diphosphate synthase
LLPRRDVATVDAILLREAPSADDADTLYLIKRLQDAGVHFLMDDDVLKEAPSTLQDGGVPIVRCDALKTFEPAPSKRLVVKCDGSESDEMLAELMATPNIDVVLLDVKEGLSRLHASRRLFALLRREASELSVVHHLRVARGTKKDELALSLGMRAGALLGDGLGDGLLVEPDDHSDFDLNYLRETSFALLQGSRMRNTKTEFVSCPSCGRTLFDLQEVTAQISEKTGHLPGVAIAIMGCIVNGPGEMADADFGYVGGAPGKVDLYVGKEVVQKAIPNEEACDALVELIKEHGMWVDKPDAVEEEAVEAELAAA